MTSRALLVTLVATAMPGCIPYTVGTTARPVPEGQWVPAAVTYYIPAGIERARNTGDTTRSLSLIGMDLEARLGLDDRSDIGVRVPGFTGIVVNYKRLLTGAHSDRAALAMLVGGGVVNAAEHAHLELALLYSARESDRLTPYGGLKLMQVLPITADAVKDRPSAGFFLGLRIGHADNGISPEIGVYYDHSALGLRRRDVIIVPSITVHGADLLRVFRR